VVIFKVDVVAPEPLGVTDEGEAAQVDSEGVPLQESTTAELKPETEFTVMVTLVLPPATTVVEAGVTVTPKSAPAPVKVTTCGLLGAESVMVSEPVRVPTTDGAKLTLMRQEAPVPRVAGQLLVWLKSPEGTMLVMVKLVVPELVSVTGTAALLVPNA